MIKGKFVRLKYSTYLRFRREFKAQRGESAASYFERLSKWLEMYPTQKLAGDKLI